MTTTRIATPADEAARAANVEGLAGATCYPHFSNNRGAGATLAAQHLRMLAVESRQIAPRSSPSGLLHTCSAGNGCTTKLREPGF